MIDSDLGRILGGKSAESRAVIAADLGRKLDSRLTSLERDIAEEIARRLAEDSARVVREALAKSVRLCPYLPKEIAFTIAYDVEEVAVPFLEVTEIFSAEELCQIARRVAQACKRAIARRRNLPASVGSVLSDCGDQSVGQTLVENDTAVLNTETLIQLVRNFDGETNLFEAMAQRDELPLPIAKLLVTRVSEKLRAHLVNTYDIPPEIVTPLIDEAGLRSILRLAERAKPLELMGLVREMNQKGKLVPATLVWAIRADGLPFFEAACALLAGWPLSQARSMIREGTAEDLRQLFAKAKIPATLWGELNFEIARLVQRGNAGGFAPSPTDKKPHSPAM